MCFPSTILTNIAVDAFNLFFYFLFLRKKCVSIWNPFSHISTHESKIFILLSFLEIFPLKTCKSLWKKGTESGVERAVSVIWWKPKGLIFVVSGLFILTKPWTMTKCPFAEVLTPSAPKLDLAVERMKITHRHSLSLNLSALFSPCILLKTGYS